MYVVDITRDRFVTDVIVGYNSMDAKRKTINYIKQYALINYNIILDEDVLDMNLNIEHFSFKDFLFEYYRIKDEKNLQIQAIPVSKDNCLFLKYIDKNQDFPVLYNFNVLDIKKAQSLMNFLINDSLINHYKNNLDEYDKLQIRYDNEQCLLKRYLPQINVCTEIISLYENGIFKEELLTSDYSLCQLKNKNFGGISI